MAEPIDFYFDFTSPYSYFAGEMIDALAARHGREVRWHPVLLGVIFKWLGSQSLVNQPGMNDYSLRDFARSARFYGLEFKMPTRFPVSTVSAARAFYSLEEQTPVIAVSFAKACFRGYFVDGVDISDKAVLDSLLGSIGVDALAVSNRMATDRIKEKVRRETDSAIALGMFGAPWIVVDGEPFWGADRLQQIDRWLGEGGF